MEKFTTLTATMVAIPTENIDTDQIIPARFLKVTDKKGLGDNLFCDWRYNADGSPKEDFILNTEQAKQAHPVKARCLYARPQSLPDNDHAHAEKVGRDYGAEGVCVKMADEERPGDAPGRPEQGEAPEDVPVDILRRGMGYAGRRRREHFRGVDIGAGIGGRHAERDHESCGDDAIGHAEGAIDQLCDKSDQDKPQEEFVKQAGCSAGPRRQHFLTVSGSSLRRERF